MFDGLSSPALATLLLVVLAFPASRFLQLLLHEHFVIDVSA
jgi:hypothetical protein